MNKKQIKELVTASYPNGRLSEKIAEKITKSLSRKDVKAYIRALRLEQQRHQVTIAIPSAKLYNTTKQTLADIFPQKDIILVEDEELLLGIRITNNDDVYDMSLKEEFQEVLNEVNKYYSS